MKKFKILSVFLAVIFAFSCFSVTAYADLGGDDGIEHDYEDMEDVNNDSIVTVHYVFADGTTAAPDAVVTIPYGQTTPLPITSPKVEGFKPDKEFIEALESGEFTVTYTKDESGSGGQQGGGGSSTPAKLQVPSLIKVKKGKKRFTATWNKVAGATGYEIQYSRNKKFKKGKKYGTKIKKVSAAKAKVTVKKLKKGKRYYVRIRAVRGSEVTAWSKAKKVKVK